MPELPAIVSREELLRLRADQPFKSSVNFALSLGGVARVVTLGDDRPVISILDPAAVTDATRKELGEIMRRVAAMPQPPAAHTERVLAQ